MAPATAWGHSALAVVRLSGEGSHGVCREIAESMGSRALDVGAPRRVRLRDAQGVFDDGLVTLAKGPATYTGEDTVEFSVHGNPLIVERLVSAAVSAGARLAGPGEFTRRAVLNGKLDLVRAEAVLQASAATTARGLEVARDAFDGRVGRFLDEVSSRLRTIAAELEARLDYPGDELAVEVDEQLLGSLKRIQGECTDLAATQSVGRVWVAGARVALVGAVNAGKSTLFNALLGRKRALVHDAPGTTRDVLEVATMLDGLAITLLDTAGERPTDDPVEAAGLALALELTGEADLLVVVLRARHDGPSPSEMAILERTADRPRLVVCNGVDGGGSVFPGAIETVAPTGQGVDVLIKAMHRALVGEEPGSSRLLIASVRQRDLLTQVAQLCAEACEALPAAGPAVAASVVIEALEALDSIRGVDTREAVLDELFTRFCIGK